MAKNITVQKIISVLLSRIRFIILITVAVGLLFFMYSKFVITPMYSSSAMIYVQNYNQNSQGTNEEAKKIYASDLNGSTALAEVCVTLFKNSDDVTALYDGCYVDISVTEETFYITINVSGDDPQKCANVANHIAEKCQEVYKSQFEYGQIGNVRKAKVPSAPYSPSNLKNTLIGFIVGLAASCVIAILLELIDTTIKADDDIQEMYGIPVFSEIPDFESQNR